MEVGDYVRTKDGIIAKITDIIKDFSIDCDRDVFHAFCNWRPDVMEIPWYYKEEYIIKSSPNIIDLIEVGDYVNGFPVLNKEENELVCGLLLRCKEKEIRRIVTKEQFESMEYKVEENK